MSLSTKLLVHGRVANVAHREITATKEGPNKGKKYTFTDVTVIGDFSLAEFRLADGLGVPELGQTITGLVEIGVYRDDDQSTLLTYVDLATVAKA